MAIDTVNDYIIFQQSLEGYRVADLQWGTPSAKQIIVRGWFEYLVSQTAPMRLCVTVRNSAYNRVYTTEVLRWNVAPELDKTDRYWQAVIPGDTTGTWLKDSGIGMHVAFVIFAGTAFRTAPNVWTAGNFLGSTNMTNVINQTTTDMAIAELGMYADPNKTGKAPPWTFTNDAQESQRWWYKLQFAQGIQSAATTISRGAHTHPTRMRITPALALVGSPTVFDGAASAALSAPTSAMNDHVAEFSGTTATLTAARANNLTGSAAAYIAISAR